MMYLWVALGSAIGGVLRYAISRAMEPVSGGIPWGTVVVNIVGCFVIGYFGTLTLAGGRFAEPPEVRIFVMVGVCGGFTTFSSFSLQTFELLRTGRWGLALGNGWHSGRLTGRRSRRLRMRNIRVRSAGGGLLRRRLGCLG